MGIIANGAITLVLWYGAKLMLEGHVTAGVLTCKYTQPLRAYISLPLLSNAILKCLHLQNGLLNIWVAEQFLNQNLVAVKKH